MAFRRVRSKSEPKFESVVDDEWLAAFPDDFDVLTDTPPAADAAPVPARRDSDEYFSR